MSTPELRNTQLRYSAGGISRPLVSYLASSGFADAPAPRATPRAPMATQRRRAAAEVARAASRLGERRILMILRDVDRAEKHSARDLVAHATTLSDVASGIQHKHRRHFGSMAIAWKSSGLWFWPMCVLPLRQTISPVLNVESSVLPPGKRCVSSAPERQTTMRSLCVCCGSLL